MKKETFRTASQKLALALDPFGIQSGFHVPSFEDDNELYVRLTLKGSKYKVLASQVHLYLKSLGYPNALCERVEQILAPAVHEAHSAGMQA